jgi:hypothetical protein
MPRPWRTDSPVPEHQIIATQRSNTDAVVVVVVGVVEVANLDH